MSTPYIVENLNGLEPGLLPQDVFEAIARLVVVPTFVIIPLFRRDGKTRVLLTRREPDDTHYAGLLHPAGKIMLATDKSLTTIFERLMKSELPEVTPVSAPVFVEQFFETITRGKEIAMVHFLEIVDPKSGAETYDTANLPSDVISTDLPRIERAVTAYERLKMF